MLRMARCVPVSLLLFSLSLVNTTQAIAQCGGTERWAVKVGTDPGASHIDLNNQNPIALSDLISLPQPHLPPPGDNTTRLSAETQVYIVRGNLIKFKFETDNDYHMIITDDTLNFTKGGPAPPSGHSFVAEIPDPSCIAGKHGDPSVQSAFKTGIESARSELESQFQNIDKSGAFNDAGGIPVQIVGVAFFDFAHGQVGRAPNNIEIHSVLGITFNPPPLNPGSFSISASPSQISISPGGTASSVITGSVTGGMNAAISLSVSGVPPNTSATFNPVLIPAPGAGASTLSLTADPSTPPGAYSLTVTATSGGSAQTAIIALTVSGSSPSPSVLITSPANGATLSALAIVNAVPTGTGTVKLEIYIDGILKACNFGASSISYPWDTTATSNGSHTVLSKAYNAAGVVGTSSAVAVSVAN